VRPPLLAEQAQAGWARFGALLLSVVTVSAVVLAQTASSPGSNTSSDGDAKLERSSAESGDQLLKQFLRDNPRARQHKLGLVSEAFTEDPSNPALRLERVLVGPKGTLLEIVGLNRVGRPDSAVIAYSSLRLIDFEKNEHPPLAFKGVGTVRDKRGEVALVVRPGERLYLLMAPIDDFRPFALAYMGADLQFSRYFDEIDPRYRERYDSLATRALASTATPEQMRDFLVEFARDDPERKAPQVFLALINKMRAQNTFEGYYNAYLLIQDPNDAKAAFRLSRTDAQKAQMENIAVATLADASRLFDMQFQVTPGSTSSAEGQCVLPCSSNFRASRTFGGSLALKVRAGDAPIKLRHGSYKVTFDTELVVPRWLLRDSALHGKADQRSDDIRKGKVTLTLHPPDYSAAVNFEFGKFDIALFERGAGGGYTAYWADGEARATVKMRSVELAE
jgi:hypothetical protein